MSPIETQLRAGLPDAAWICRAPGRVNLIGEHLDYNGYPVLPFAIAQSAWIAVAPRRDGLLQIRHLDAARYPEELLCLPDLDSRPRRGFWSDYVVAGLRVGRARGSELQGAELLVGADLPIAAGLSSSSALVCAASLALLHPSQAFEASALAQAAAQAERFVGTETGGMDQAASFLGAPGQALHLRFAPLRCRSVALPADFAMLVLDSGVPAAKSGAAQAAYNARVADCRAVAAALGVPGELLGTLDPSAGSQAVGGLAHPRLRMRARHVFSEAERVEASVAALADGDLARLGQLLDASHASLSRDYQVGHPALDDVVGRARQAGALGARMVGAGFGGSVIALSTREAVAGLAAALPEELRVLRVEAAAGAESVPC